MFTFPGIRVGNPICHESLTVFPLFAEPNSQVEYLLSDEALQAGSVTVQEVSEGGSVPDLLVENTGTILDAVGAIAEKGRVTQPAVEATLAELRNSSWEKVEPVGDGEEYRVKSNDGTQASALAFGDSLVHGSLLTGA